MDGSLSPSILSLETQLLSIMDVLVKTAVTEISQLFSESSATLRLHLTQSLRENDSLRMRVKLMRSELFSLKVQTRTSRSSSRFTLVKASTPKPRAKAQVSSPVNSEAQTASTITEKSTSVESPDIILIKDEDESEGCSVGEGHESHNNGTHVDLVKHQDDQSQAEEPRINQSNLFFNAAELPTFSSMCTMPTVSHDGHLSLPTSCNETMRMGHNDIIVGMAMNDQLERTPITQSVSTSVTGLVSQTIGPKGGAGSHVHPLPKQQKSIPKPLCCNVCHEQFNTRSELNAHRASHTGDAPVSCDMCRKLFVSKNTLGIHMRIHTGEKPYVCLLCGKRFTQNGGLRIHLRTHSGEKPYTCSMCQTSFNNPSNLRRHMITHNSV